MDDAINSLDKLFSKKAIQILNNMTFDEDTTYFYELMSGGFLWSDEFPDINSSEWSNFEHDYVYRYLLAQRRQVMLEHKGAEEHPLWLQITNQAPDWPGLRPERLKGRIVNRLKAAIRKSNYEIDKCFDEYDDENSLKL